MSFVNRTDQRLLVCLDQVSTLYWHIINPGERFSRETGAVHFTINIYVVSADITNENYDARGAAGACLLGLGAERNPNLDPSLATTRFRKSGYYAGNNHRLQIIGGGKRRLDVISE